MPSGYQGEGSVNRKLRKIISYYKPYRRLFIGDMLCAALISLIALALPLCVRAATKALQQGVTAHTLTTVYSIGALMLALIAVHTACTFFVDYQGHSMGALMEGDMRRELFAHLQKLSFSFYDRRRTGELMSRLTNDLFWLTEFFHHGPEDLIIGLITFVGVFAISLTISPALTGIIFLFLPFMALYAYYFNRRMIRALTISKARIATVNSQVEDSLGGIRVVQSFSNEAIENRKFAQANAAFVKSRHDSYRNEAAFYAGMVSFTNLIPVAVVVFGGVYMVGGALDLADLLTYFLYVGLLLEPIRRLVNFARLYQEAIAGFNRFVELLEITPEIKDAPNALTLRRVRGEIEFQNVSFSYNSDGEAVLQNVNLRIVAGDYVALVGYSGVGKSTLCSLIPRFYDVSAGRILLDGRDIRHIRLASLRRHIGVVHQDVYLFAGTVAENIRYGRPDAGDDEVRAAARKAHAHDFITRLPHGYNTEIGQRGIRLSGGQKQRLSIARAFLKDPPIIIFDEATSSLDGASERAIQLSMDALAHNRTTIVIAHRHTTIRNARRIIALDENGLREVEEDERPEVNIRRNLSMNR